MTTYLDLIGYAVLGYLSGSLPFAIWVTRLFKGVDVRDAGSGHATTTNTIGQAGFGPGALVFCLDVAKGCVPVWLALHFTALAWVAPLTAACAVIGHCWPVFAQFRGGMGLAPAGGGLLAVTPLALLVPAALLIGLVLITRHPARASVLAALATAPVFWLLHLRGIELWIAAAVGVILACRFLIDWNRQYRELWLDRAKKGPQ